MTLDDIKRDLCGIASGMGFEARYIPQSESERDIHRRLLKVIKAVEQLQAQAQEQVNQVQFEPDATEE
jgi:hypothetical protein